MNQIPFEKNYAGLMPDAAEWLVKNTTIKFIGVDYMSVASFNYVLKVHEILLNKPGVIPVECLNLEGVEPGYYDVYCLPTKIETEGVPARCILMKPTKAKRTILDITHTLKNYMTVWKNYAQTGEIIREHNGTHFRSGDFTVGTDYGTHVDSPQHLLSLKDSPISALTFDLQTLIGRVLVVRIPTGVRNISAQVVSNLGLPRGIERVIFKTDNTDRRLMNKIAFETDYTGLTPDAADLLVKNTTIKFIGVDYMSVASFDYHHQVHEILLNKPGVIPVECLNLKGVEPGYYDVYCLPIKVAMEAATARCILMNTRH